MVSLCSTSSRDLRPRLRTLVDVRALEAVEASHGQIQLFDGHLEHGVGLLLDLLDDGGTGADGVGEVGEKREMVAEDLRAQRDGVPCGHGLVRPDLDGQLVKVGLIADTGVFHRVVDLEDRGIDGVDGDGADGHLGVLVLVGGDVASAVVKDQLHAQRTVGTEGRDGLLGVEDLHLGVGLDVAGGDKALAGGFNVDGLRGKLMLNTGDLDAGACDAGEGREKYPAKRVTKRSTIAALQRLDDIFAVRAVCGRFNALDTRLFNFDHIVI